MTTELPKTYDPKAVEADIYAAWEKAGAFAAEPDDAGQPFCMVIPPPNVTAALHLGHALNNTLQDVLIRWRRMQGRNTLWMPGTDHAGIATQTVVDKRLQAEGEPALADYRRREAAGQGGREQFVAKVQAWKDAYERRILEQLQLMGCSCDWRRTRFTMDETCARAVREAFFRLFRDGLIYRGKRLVNWDPATQTVLADDEVEYEDVQGHFWYLQYPLVEPVNVPAGDARGTNSATITHVTVATTRPETMLGDTAVAINPADPRAAHLVGKHVRLPIVGRVIPIIADEHVVLPDPDSDDERARFSTGFLKVTPAHDPDDYQIGERHLDEIGRAVAPAGEDPRPYVFTNILAPDGTISDRHGWEDWDAVKNPDVESLIGLDRFEAREAVVEFFRQEGLLEDVREYTHSVGHSYRSHVPVEPYLSDQWYVAVKKPISNFGLRISDWVREHPNLVEQEGERTLLAGTDIPVNSLAGLALAPLLDGRVTFVPDRYADTYRTWLENLRDWPISRQLWWGHRIPVWKKATGDRVIEGTLSEDSRSDQESGLTVAGIHVPEQTGWENDTESVFYCPPPGHPEVEAELERLGAERDPDVLDTWFSSALWPFSTMGWPAETPEMEAYYPGDVLCTAREIITLWVSRMVMLGQYCAGDIPFSQVFIHAMIQDGEGRKMSKSLGNGIDPLEVIDSHGADALRFTLTSMTTQTQDVRMPVEEMELPDGRRANTSPKFDMGRNFCNKLWNAARFALGRLDRMPAWAAAAASENLADRWIRSRLNAAIRDATAALEAFRFNDLADTLYHFFWDDFCDWYLEIAKARTNAGEAAPKALLACGLDVVLRLLHPICPFITEAIWARLNEAAPRRGPGDTAAEKLLIRAAWPTPDEGAIDGEAERQFATLQEIIREVRNARSQHNVPPSARPDALAEAAGGAAELLEANRDLLGSQAGLGEVTVSAEPVERPKDAAAVTAAGVRLYVLGVVDVEAERARLGKQADGLRKGLRGAEVKLNNESFVAKAPAEVVQRERDRLKALQAELASVEQSLAELE